MVGQSLHIERVSEGAADLCAGEGGGAKSPMVRITPAIVTSY
jgi:hypothetical protein